MIKVLLATTSISKIEDISYIVRECFGKVVHLTSLNELGLNLGDAPETKDTVRGNSEEKLIYYLGKIIDTRYKDEFDFIMTEDTGLFIDALGGAPGVKTARFSGSHNYKKTNELILNKMKDQGVKSCTIKSCISITNVKLNDRLISSFDREKSSIVLDSESEVDGFAFDTITRPVNSVFSYSELKEFGKLSRLMNIPRTYSVIAAVDYIIKEIYGK